MVDNSFDEAVQRCIEAFEEFKYAIGVAIIAGLIDGIVSCRLPLWFVYLILGLLLVVITLVLGVR